MRNSARTRYAPDQLLRRVGGCAGVDLGTSRGLDTTDGSGDSSRAMPLPLRPDARWRRARATGGVALVFVLGACVSDGHARDETPVEPVTFESRTGIPVLMDLPLIGWLFQHRVTVR